MSAGAAPLSQVSEAAVGEVIAQAATRGERAIAALRFAFVSMALGRSFWVWSGAGYGLGAPAIVAVGASAVLLGFSLFVLFRYRNRVASPALLLTSASLDAAACFAVLIGNPLWPGPDYPGIARMPDMAAFLIVIMVTALRLSASVSIAVGCLALSGMLALAHIDASLTGPPVAEVAHHLAGYAVLLVASSGIAAVIASRTRRMVRAGAQRALEADRTQRNLAVLLEDHHDVRTLLSSASLNAGLLRRGLDRDEDGDSAERREVAAQLCGDLERVNAFVASIKERSHGDLLTLQALAPAEVRTAAEYAIAAVQERFADVHLAVIEPEPAPAVFAAGGRRGLERILLNLVVNACEGNGQHGAKRVQVGISGSRSGESVRVDVCDDGPGLPSWVLDPGKGGPATTKQEGSGLGLSLVANLVEASLGQLSLTNRPTGGAQVSVELTATADGAPPPTR